MPRINLALLMSLLLVALSACQIPPAERKATATVLVDGPNVFINGNRARNGATLKSGDTVATGRDSSALIRFSDGTEIQLAESTDPFFEWLSDTVDVAIDYGAMAIETGSELSVRVFNDVADVFYNSEGVVEVERQGEFRAYLFSGQLTVLAPRYTNLGPMQFVLVRPGREPEVGVFTGADMRQLRAQFDRYRFSDLVEVPSVVGLDLRDAERRLRDARLDTGRVTRKQTRDARPGIVLEQSPTAGRRARMDSGVDLIVAEEVEARVPNLDGSTLTGARRTLDNLGLRLGNVRYRDARSYEKDGEVVDQSPSAGRSVSPGSSVDVVVARKVEPQRVRVPDVEGELLRDAIRFIESRNLKVGRITGATSGERWVYRQNPEAGRLVTEGATVDLVVQTVIQ